MSVPDSPGRGRDRIAAGGSPVAQAWVVLPVLLIFVVAPAFCAPFVAVAIRSQFKDPNTVLPLVAGCLALFPPLVAWKVTRFIGHAGWRATVAALMVLLFHGGAVAALRTKLGIADSAALVLVEDTLRARGVRPPWLEAAPVPAPPPAPTPAPVAATPPGATPNDAPKPPAASKKAPPTGPVTEAVRHVPGTLYQWKDKTGALQITDTPPPVGASLLTILPPEPGKSSSPPPPATPAVIAAPAPPDNNAPRAAESFARRPPEGALAPALRGEAADGSQVALRSLVGLPVLIAFSTTTCGYCKAEAKSIHALQGKYRGRVNFLTALPGEAGSPDARKWAQDFGLDASSVLTIPPTEFPDGGVPYNVLVDRKGTIIRNVPGRLSSERMEDLLAEVL